MLNNINYYIKLKNILNKIIGYGYIDPAAFPENNLQEPFQDYEEEPEELEELIDVPLYDLTLDSEENFQDGIETKYILLPVNKDGVVNETSFTPLLNAGGKILMSNDTHRQNMDYVTDFFVVDYNTMFGLRLLVFQKYNSKFFSCDERIFFETLLIKLHGFHFKPFFMSYTTIFNELGIKKDRAITISIKFHKLGFLKTEIKTKSIEGRPSQVTFYYLDTDKIIELLPQIYIQEHFKDIDRDIKKYLEPALKKVSTPAETIHIFSIMQ
jgi:hypothetical protein